MKKTFFSLLIILIFYNFTVAEDRENDWNIVKSTHFVVYYKNTTESFIKGLVDKSEDYYNSVANDLGFRRFNFWLWDNRAKIYIYDNKEEYQSVTSQPSWSSGCANTRDKTITTFFNSQGFFEIILPHEIGHIIFREFVGFDNNAVPRWLDEGVASYQQKLKYSASDAVIKNAIDAGKFITLDNLFASTPNLKMSNDDAQLSYAESFSIVNFLIKKFGKDNFVVFCQNLRDKKDLKKALVSSYPFKNIQELETAWKQDLITSE